MLLLFMWSENKLQLQYLLVFQTAPVQGTMKTFRSMLVDTVYTVRVIAVSNHGASAPSDSVQVATKCKIMFQLVYLCKMKLRLVYLYFHKILS